MGCDHGTIGPAKTIDQALLQDKKDAILGHSEPDHRLFGADMLPNPYPVYDALRQQDPVQWNETVNAWVVTSHKEASFVLKSRDLSSDRVSIARSRYPEAAQPAFDVLSRVMVQVDDPHHKKLRNLVHSAFTRTAVQDYESTVVSLCRDLLAPPIERGEMEFMAEFAIPLPLLVISEIVGVPPQDRARIKVWCDAYSFLILNFYVHIDADRLVDCTAKLMEFCDYLRDRIAEAMRVPQPGLITSMALAAQEDPTLTTEDVVANCILLLNAGNETTSCLLGTGMRLLMENPDQLAILRANPDLIPNAIEEFMRIDSPVQFLGRVAAVDLEIGGHAISKGDMVLPVIGAANRDPAAFEDPGKLDVTRVHNHQLGFGTGPHMCAGIQLARFEARVAFEYLLENLSMFKALPVALSYVPNFNMRSLSVLPMAVAAKTG